MKDIPGNISNIKTSDYFYNLPENRIAKYPLKQRDNSKLLICKNGKITESIFNRLPEYLPSGSFLVFNNTKVIQARIFFKKETGAVIEVFCLEPYNPADYQLAFQQTKEVVWRCMVGNAGKWKRGKLFKNLSLKNKDLIINAELIERQKNDFIIRFAWDVPFTFGEILEKIGITPIPPYLNRDSEDSDKERYQTTYAKFKGSVAAPTAGLHFSENLINKIIKEGFRASELTLHVGAGTFQPVKSESIKGHNMHNEMVSVTKDFLKELIEHEGKVIPVGTTSVRSLESLYWLGVQLQDSKNKFSAFVNQWEPYETENKLSKDKAITAILDYLEKKNIDKLHFTTQLMIVPGYDFKIIDGMLTNFHQPGSTLLMLIAAYLGNQWKEVYKYALENDFRFLSYGDSNLYIR